MPDVTFTVDGDTTRLVISAKKGEVAYKNLGKAVEALGGGMEKAGKQAEQAGKKSEESFGRAALNMGRVVVAARMAIAALNAVGSSLSASMDKAASRAEGRGGARLRAGQAAAESGMNQKIVSAFMTSNDSAANQEQKAAFVEAIAKEGGVDDKRFIELTSYQKSGVFSDARLKEAITSGEKLDIAAESAKLGPGALQEIATRKRINDLEAQPGAFSGDVARVAKAVGDSVDRGDPGKAALRDALPDFLTIEQKTNNLKAADKLVKDDKKSAEERTARAAERLAADSKKQNYSGMTDNQ